MADNIVDMSQIKVGSKWLSPGTKIKVLVTRVEYLAGSSIIHISLKPLDINLPGWTYMGLVRSFLEGYTPVVEEPKPIVIIDGIEVGSTWVFRDSTIKGVVEKVFVENGSKPSFLVKFPYCTVKYDGADDLRKECHPLIYAPIAVQVTIRHGQNNGDGVRKNFDLPNNTLTDKQVLEKVAEALQSG